MSEEQVQPEIQTENQSIKERSRNSVIFLFISVVLVILTAMMFWALLIRPPGFYVSDSLTEEEYQGLRANY